MRMLSSSSPVTAITRSARWMPARSRIHSSVASPYWTACSSSVSTTRKRRWSDSMSVTSRSLAINSRARFHPTLPAPAMITYIPRLLSGRQGHARGLVDGDLGRAGREQPLLCVPGGAGRVGHAHHDARDVETTLSNLGDDQVGVVTAGGGQ